MMTLQTFNILAALLLCQQAFVESAVEECSGDAEYSILGMMLGGHIFKNITGAPLGNVCLRECYHDVRCQSFNYVISKETCELNNRTKEARPEDFVPNTDRYYFKRGMKRVRLGSIPDLPAQTCKEIKESEGEWADNGNYWLYFLEIEKILLAYCDMRTKDVDECSASGSFCDVNADCENTRGSYRCLCKPGLTGDGKTCSGQDFQPPPPTPGFQAEIQLAYSFVVYMIVAAFSAVFTNLNASVRNGPTALGSHYTGQDHDGQVTLSNGIQLWTVPYTGDYRIEAIGAAGGYDTYPNSTQHRGRGARMIGTFGLSKDEIIQILVGQEGGINNYSHGSGGGGGTFVVRGSNTSLIIAGGGGGVDTVLSRHAGCDANTSTTGNPGYRSWAGGSNGHGAQTADSSTSGGGGGGFYSSGRSGKNFNGTIGNGGEGGKGFLQGGEGGRARGNNVDGGFGGGGGSAGTVAGGGGGGYSGGSSGRNHMDSCGGGGGSYNTGTNQQNDCCFNTAGHGQVTISLL